MALKVVDPIILADASPMTIAEAFVTRHPNLKHWQKDYFDWDGKVYVNVPDGAMDKKFYHFLEQCIVFKPVKSTPGVKKPTEADGEVKTAPERLRAYGKAVDELNRAVKVLTYLPTEMEPFADPDIAPFHNGLLDLRDDQLYPHTPELFNFHVLPFDYQPNLGPPIEWLKFLDSVWGQAPGNIRELQKIYGYYLSGSNVYQKIFFIFGPTRSGKGTIADVLVALLGGIKRVAPLSMENFSGTHGMEGLIGKIAAIMPDLRQGKRSDLGAIVERLLTISGNDNVAVQRKYKGPWHGKLGCRILVMSNDVPQLPDSTGTISYRFHALEMTKSFLGKEDKELPGRLMPELPQIMNWALEGLRLLRAEGFIQQDNNLERKIRASASSLQEFVDEELILDPNARTFQDQVYTRFKEWTRDNGHATMSHTQFKIRLESLSLGVTAVRPMVNGKPGTRMWQGIRLVNHLEIVRSPFDDTAHFDNELHQPAAADAADDGYRLFRKVCDD